MDNKTTIGILGVGAIGTVIACHLQEQIKNELFYFSRTKREQLHLISKTSTYTIPVDIQTETTTSPNLDWLIVCIKAHQYNDAQQWFSPLISSKTKVAVIRNGLHLKTPFLKFTSEAHILECSIDCPTQQSQNDYYEIHKTPIITVPKGSLASKFEALFDTSKIHIRQVDDYKTESWKKLCESATLGAILCLHNDTCRIFKAENRQQEFKDLLQECIQVAIADGAQIESHFVDILMNKVLAYPDTKGSSMLTDLRHGNRLELEAKNGIISKLGNTYNVKTPINDMIIKLLS
ncbi:ketopantoate reductase family protein [Psychroserpens sp. SPM9]|uniref:ketopantoate reductase family protein n=1 Tax=Psychroserpens sp. SPM9 TaxID=2975598 RepID=UPI0021A7F169|nr:ketopantoate reductase C-terminal domain-containing protein [Psychroserpens sp. SPM9]MDG5493008.1 ketopantoate reductase C-terminal domain-containing protein [Psychroserpens sp. SPM9]